MGMIRKRLTLVGRRRNKQVECLFDTGASSSFIRPELARAMGVPTVGLLKPLRIRLGKGSTQVSRIAAVMIQLNGSTLADTAYVMPGLSEDYVLGVKFLERYNIQLDPKRRRLLLPPKKDLSLIFV